MPANTKYDNTPLVDCTSQEEEEEEEDFFFLHLVSENTLY